ncbi:DUF29 domain-containing protein [Pseudanabaena galeata UHCC 0370]|uniref:DUF29 domain-containing protein n=1 Tax=Pseudanabaena galeata UHCC 0370 TaxID=3110310 RepID=A0ABU5TMC6_9CYAN|nr:MULTISPECIES: DUF29 domain-containing protein [Pseudanabaena]MEA5479456.1 DUF29 domain-containing protein [Pseudanabaena galeata UHCC 0370]MEA5488098.1 DUF29 domain-containing protein [Pseudanabaena sp. CCNP1317]WGS71557.1 DUF29 domain-containing protein [Pseudanabaena galeata CCNP1313]
MTQLVARKSLYDSDYLLWTQETIAKLKARDFENVDLDNLIEEIESLGKSERKEIKSRLTVLLEHLLKRMYVDMPDCFSGWENTISTQRNDIELTLMDSPSLKALWDESFDIAFKLALRSVRKNYKAYQFPDTWQFSRDIDTMLNVDFWEE